jgi:hypothetical protein
LVVVVVVEMFEVVEMMEDIEMIVMNRENEVVMVGMRIEMLGMRIEMLGMMIEMLGMMIELNRKSEIVDMVVVVKNMVMMGTVMDNYHHFGYVYNYEYVYVYNFCLLLVVLYYNRKSLLIICIIRIK